MDLKIIESDWSGLEGTECYCSEEAAAEIRTGISRFPVESVRYIGTGDYHYQSLFWLERVTEPVELILLDNHPDDQEGAFGDALLSCGGWVRKALELPAVRKFRWIDGNGDCHVKMAGGGNGDGNGDGNCCPGSSSGQDESGSRAGSKDESRDDVDREIPVYLSIDLDILSTEFAHTNWDQGSLTLDELCGIIRRVKADGGQRLLAADICGGLGAAKGGTPEDEVLNRRTIATIADCLLCRGG